MHPSFNRLTSHAKQAISYAQKLSGETNLRQIDSLYLAIGIISQKGSLGENLAAGFHIQKSKLLTYLKNSHHKKSASFSCYDALIKAYRVALSSKSPFVGTEHILYGLLSLPGQLEKFIPEKIYADKSNLPTIPKKTTLSKEKEDAPAGDIFGQINMLIDNFFSASADKEKTKKRSHLASFCSNLNELVQAEEHLLIGRKTEMERISNILGRKTKNNPVLIGDPGVGKTAIVEGLALQIKQGKAPFYLANKKILSLDLGLLIAGTTFRGEFEARLKEVIAEAKQNPNLILFIDEIHNLVGAGNSIGGMDAANMLKPALSRGQIQVIGATTFEEYRKYIEKDAALERRFQPVVVNEPSVEETIAIIRGIKNNFETYHSIEITDAAICQAASLAKRYIIDRFLPDSAIDLIDETAARIRSKQMNTRLFKMLLNKETKLESVIKDKETLVVNDRFEDAIRLRNKEKQLQNEITGLKKQLTAYQKKHRTSMDEKEIQQTISSHTRIPTELLNADNINILKSVAEHLKQNIFGQDEAVQKINETLLRQFSGVGAPDRPLGSFLFVGPSGVGKTYTAKLLAQSIAAGNTESLIHINMSEFMERHTVSKLLGAPAGYVGYDDSADLMEKIRRNPYSVVLFDEIDKADPSVLNILLQIMEEGSINDSKGRKINFRNTIIILTSNIGTEELNQLSRLGFELSEDKIRIKESETKKIVMEELKEQLAPEFLNRLDHIIVFEPLLEEQIKKIIRHELEILSKRLAEKSISLNYPQSVIDFLTKNSIDPQQGARLIRKQIESRIEPLIAKKLLESSKNCFNLTIRQDNITIR
jgi:ATP-dependent Clp protease ATP-binding subunit ClpC